MNIPDLFSIFQKPLATLKVPKSFKRGAKILWIFPLFDWSGFCEWIPINLKSQEPVFKQCS